MAQTNSVTITLSNPSLGQLNAIRAIMIGDVQGPIDARGEEEEAPKKRTRKAKPENTVSDDEDENFGKKKLTKKDLEEDEEIEEEEDEEGKESHDEEETEEEDDEEGAISFATVRAALNKYGDKKPLACDALLKSFGVNNKKDLSAASPKKLEKIYRKVIAVTKALKRS